jgi:hypothetical protein
MRVDKNNVYLADNHGIYGIITNLKCKSIYALGAGGRGFESRYPDEKKPLTINFVGGFFIYKNRNVMLDHQKQKKRCILIHTTFSSLYRLKFFLKSPIP